MRNYKELKKLKEFLLRQATKVERKTVVLLLSLSMTAMAQQDSLPASGDHPTVGDHRLSVGLNMLTHGEMRLGGLDVSGDPDDISPDDDHAYFLMERTRLTIDYQRTGLEARVAAQHQGIWGQKGQGSVNLYEAWAKLSAKNGLFAQIGRQALSYDDERIIGPNDWAMAAMSHDVLRAGYEGHGHKVHLILAYNQNAENTYGGTYYADGSQPYKTMHTLWYHYDVAKTPLGVSLLFMNIGMQGGKKDGIQSEEPHTRYQQLYGGYLSYRPKNLQLEASYYCQKGHNEGNIKIDAWMASIKAQLQVSRQAGLVAGYDYLSGDKYFAIPGEGQIGVIRHTVIKGFNPVYGSHHKFYGMMDFFYVSTYLSGFTPGLQNLYAGGSYSPVKDLSLKLTYHYMATATQLDAINMTLGHDIDLEASYQIMKDARLSLGFSYMTGTDSMQKLKRAGADDNLKWGWFSLVVSPRLFSTALQRFAN